MVAGKASDIHIRLGAGKIIFLPVVKYLNRKARYATLRHVITMVLVSKKPQFFIFDPICADI